MGLSALWSKFYKTLASIRTGVILLILVVVFSVAGTFVLQRPSSDPGQLERVYSPNTLLWLDRIGLTDVFHSWWFLTLLALVSLSIVFASLETRLDRLTRIRGMSREEALARINKQATDEQRRAVADIAIENDGTAEDLDNAVALAWQRISPS